MDAPLYLLDTNIVIHAARGARRVLDKLSEVGRHHLAIPALVAAELAYGVEKSARRDSNRAVLADMLGEFTVLPWTQAAMWHYARHFHALRTAGRLIGHMDLLIGAQALSLDATLVTNNTREFERIEGLPLEDWTQ